MARARSEGKTFQVRLSQEEADAFHKMIDSESIETELQITAGAFIRRAVVNDLRERGYLPYERTNKQTAQKED